MFSLQTFLNLEALPLNVEKFTNEFQSLHFESNKWVYQLR